MSNIVAHRGIFNNQNIPENSMESFNMAIDKKCPIEFDIHITKDNKLIVFHDDNGLRMLGVDKNIEDFTLDEIKNNYLIGTSEIVPTLREVLDLIAGKVDLIIEIKETKRYKKLLTELFIELDNYNKNIMIQSFDYKIIKLTKEKYISGLLMTREYKNIYFNFFLHKLKLWYCKPNFISINKKLLKYNFYVGLLNKYKTYIWTLTVDKIHQYKADGYICNIESKKDIR